MGIPFIDKHRILIFSYSVLAILSVPWTWSCAKCWNLHLTYIYFGSVSDVVILPTSL